MIIKQLIPLSERHGACPLADVMLTARLHVLRVLDTSDTPCPSTDKQTAP